MSALRSSADDLNVIVSRQPPVRHEEIRGCKGLWECSSRAMAVTVFPGLASPPGHLPYLFMRFVHSSLQNNGIIDICTEALFVTGFGNEPSPGLDSAQLLTTHQSTHNHRFKLVATIMRRDYWKSFK
ncbi:hypothetical protein CBL_11549 [Carabus blaptoides fortunei]